MLSLLSKPRTSTLFFEWSWPLELCEKWSRNSSWPALYKSTTAEPPPSFGHQRAIALRLSALSIFRILANVAATTR